MLHCAEIQRSAKLKTWLLIGWGMVPVLVCGSGWANAAPGATINQALTLTKQGKYSDAIDVYERILKSKPYDSDALTRVGPLYFLTGRHSRARSRYRLVVRKRPSFAKGFYYYAYALRLLGECTEAMAAYRSYRKLKPSDPYPFYGMARCAVTLQKYGDARIAYDRFILGAAGRPEMKAWVLRAKAERTKLRQRLAAQRSVKAVREVLLAAKLAQKDGAALKAEKLLAQGLKKHPGALLLVGALADLLIRQRRCAEVVPLVTKALKAGKPFIQGRYKLALCQRLTKDYEGAERNYRAVLKVLHKHPDAHYGLAETLRLAGKAAEALRVYKSYVVIEQRPAEQHWVTKARGYIATLTKKLASAPGPAVVASRPGPRPAVGTAPTTAGSQVVTDPRIRAILEARRRFERRQRGLDVDGAPGRVAPRRPPATGPAGLSRAERRRQRLEERRRKQAEQRQRYAEIVRKRKEARQKRAEERRQRLAEMRRKAEEAKRQRAEERRRKREALLAKMREQKAKKLVQKVLSGGSNKLTPEVHRAAVGLARKAPPARALAIWKRLNELKPNDEGVTRALAEAATRAGAHRVAARAYQALITRHPKNMALTLKLRAAQGAAGLSLTPLPLKRVIPASVAAARRAFEAGRIQEAVTLALATLKQNPRDGYVVVLLADAALKLGRYKKALALANRALRLNGTLAGPYRVIGTYHLRMRDRSEALKYYRAFMKQVVRDASEVGNRARIEAMVNRLGR